jgi:hypothetical protein
MPRKSATLMCVFWLVERHDEWNFRLVHGLSGATQASAGAVHSGVVDATGAVYTWGDALHGKLGHGPDLTQVLRARARRVRAVPHLRAGRSSGRPNESSPSRAFAS